jgi:hypothetical protein
MTKPKPKSQLIESQVEAQKKRKRDRTEATHDGRPAVDEEYGHDAFLEALLERGHAYAEDEEKDKS